jgi:hypothetical protein
MPTLSYILETAEDRYWESKAAQGIAPHHPAYTCVICGMEFDSADRRSWHATEAHPMARPTLYLGAIATASEVVVRAPVAPAELRVESCTSVRVAIDGSPFEVVAPDALASLVAGCSSGHLSVELENHRAADETDVRATYAIRISIPDDADLAGVDRAFVRHLAIDRPSTRDIEAFASEVGSLPSARMYAGALADYVHGILIKEGSDFGGATLPFEAFEAKFSRALVELADHSNRPVAASVVASTRLNLNEFLSPVPESGDARLDSCVRTLRGLVAPNDGMDGPAERLGSATVALCPIDRDTNTVLVAHDVLARIGPEALQAEELAGRAEDPSLSPQDRSKLRALIAHAFIRGGRFDDARRHVEVLAHDGVFGEWATRELEEAA